MVLRAVLVVGLLAAAALSLSARNGLDWEQLADPLEVRWARVVVGTVLGLLLGVLARGVLRRLRRARPRPAPKDGRSEPEGEPFPLLLRVLAVVLVLASLAVAWEVIDALAPDVPGASVAPLSPEGPAADESLPPRGPDWPTLLLVAAALVVVAVVARLGARRGDIAEEDGARVPDEPAPDAAGSDAAALSAAVGAGEAELSAQDDPRAAILAAYAAMTARIESGLAAGGRSASPADTPTELLERAGAAGIVDGTAAGTLTALFREARFSRHPMGEAHRRDAERALTSVRDQLAVRRA